MSSGTANGGTGGSGVGGGTLYGGVRTLSWSESLAHARRCKAHSRAVTGPAAFVRQLGLHCPGPDAPVRLYALGLPDDRKADQTLLVASLTQDPSVKGRDWEWAALLAADPEDPAPAPGSLSKEEELRLERMRLTSKGISSYALLPQHHALLYAQGKAVFVAKDTAAGPVTPRKVRFAGPQDLSPMDPQLCPVDPTLFAWTAKGDVWAVVDQEGQAPAAARLTFANEDGKADPALFYGAPTYVVQEEFDRYQGLFWSPRAERDGAKLLLVEEVDERAVDVVGIGASGSLVDTELERMRYPRAGAVNAKTGFLLTRVETTASPQGPVLRSSLLKLADSLKTLYPWAEYVPRLGWLPDGTAVYAQILNRNQDKTALLHIPLGCFVGEDGKRAEEGPGAISVLLSEENSVWINTHNILHFLPSTSAQSVGFLWGSERSGFLHIYKVKAVVGGAAEQSSLTAVTQGDWSVLPRFRPVVDPASWTVYFAGLKDSVVEAHVYAASYAKPELGVCRLTGLGKYALSGQTAPGLALHLSSGILAVQESSLTEAPFVRVYKLQPQPGALPTATSLGTVRSGPSKAAGEPKTPEDGSPTGGAVSPGVAFNFSLHDQPPPRLLSYDGERTGMRHHALLFSPPASFPLKTRRPTILHVYGGPGVQLVKNQWVNFGVLKYTSLGYCVVVLDGRGSANRGLRWEGLLRHAMGQEEMGDQVEGLRAVAAQTGELLDLERVAVTGWSYGGFASLWAIVQFPQLFKVAMAGGPVVDYRLYDSAYTERYMGTPQDEPAAYEAAELSRVAERFPATPGRLLLLHGVQDENVHLRHTHKLMGALNRHGKPYKVRLFPGERHGIRDPANSDYVDAQYVAFLQDALLQGIL